MNIIIKDIEDYDIETLLAMAERIAVRKYDGHFTIYRFTNCWSVCFTTPLDSPLSLHDSEIRQLEKYVSLKEALIHLLENEDSTTTI